MSKITKIDSYRTSDGMLFEDKIQASKHQLFLDWRAWYSEHVSCGDGPNNMLNWLIKHHEEISVYIERIKEEKVHALY